MSTYKERGNEILKLISDIKIDKNLTDAQLAKKIGMPIGTFGKRKAQPENFRAFEIWALETLAGRRVG